MPVSAFDSWFEFYMEEPWGYEFEMYRHAEICTYLVNGLYKPKQPVKPKDFYPQTEADFKKEQSAEDIKSILKGRFRNGQKR